MEQDNDFSKGHISKLIFHLAIPMTLAQFINILYNVVDRMYIGKISNYGSMALTGVGLTFPIITFILAFANLFGMGGAPLCSLERGKGNIEEAEKIIGNAFSLLISSGVIITVLGLLIKTPIIFLFGASSDTYIYANNYITIYLIGSVFVMISLGMNSFINSQGFAKTGMITTLIGAVINIILDPIFIFFLNMGVTGATLATVISQFLSALWVLKFLTSKKAILKLRRKYLKIDYYLSKKIIGLGLSGFIMGITNSLVQIVCNINLSIYGGDLYIGIMTVLNSIREVVTMPVLGITNAAQPVISFNYGAQKIERVKKGINFMSISCIAYTFIIWIILRLFPEFFISIFNSSEDLIKYGTIAMNIYFFGFFMMSLQFSGQSTYLSLEKSKHAIFFSLFRKVIIVIPLTFLLPKIYDLGVIGVFLAEPISNFIGGLACYLTMRLSIYDKLSEQSG